MAEKKTSGKPLDVFGEIREHCDSMTKLRQAEVRAQQQLEQKDRELTAARKKLGEATATALADGNENLDGLPEAAAFEKAKSGVERMRSALTSIRQRIAASDATTLSLRERLTAQREPFNREKMTRFIEQRAQPAAAEYAQVLRAGHALADALGIRMSPNDGDGTLGAALLKVPVCGPWRDDAEAQRIHAEHREPKQMADALHTFASDAVVRVKSEERRHVLRHRYNPDPGARYRAIRQFATSDGRTWEPGDELTYFTIGDPTLLPGLVESHRIQLILDDDQ